MRADDLVRLRHIRDATNDALSFVAGRTREELDHDRMLAMALTRAIEIIGEAAARIHPDTQAGTPAIPWAQIIGMRNRLVHGYYDVDLDRVWDTVQVNLPPFLSLVQTIIDAEDNAA